MSSRLPAAERRAAILDVAREQFGARGYHGTTTDQIASAAGISQPYVVRMFGSKEALFLEVLGDTMDVLMEAWRSTLAAVPEGSTVRERKAALGDTFLALARTRGFHTVLLQAFVSGAEPAIGAAARKGFLAIYRFLVDEARFPEEYVHEFLGSGMLYSIMLGIDMPSRFDVDPDAAGLMHAAFGDACLAIVQMSKDEAAAIVPA
jgi:TetR/AcrR family transcriptional regulator